MCDRVRICVCGVLVFLLAGAASADLPGGWRTRDIGDVGLAGSAERTDGLWTIRGSGAEIGGEADEFHFCYVRVSGDTEIIARVIGVADGSDDWARAGVMIRETLKDDSDYTLLALRRNTGSSQRAVWQWRSVSGSSSPRTYTLSGHTPGDPMWVKIERRDSTMTGYISLDGVTWEDLYVHSNPMLSDVYIGLAVTSSDRDELATGTFDNVTAGPYSCWATACNPVPPNGSEVSPYLWYDDPFVKLEFDPNRPEAVHTVYFSDDINDVINRDSGHSLGSVPPWPDVLEHAFYVGYDDPAIPEFAREPLIRRTTYYWCVDEFEGEDYRLGDIWSFTVMPREVWHPSPEDGAQDVLLCPKLTLRWDKGDTDPRNVGYDIRYAVYYGTDFADVNESTEPNIVRGGGFPHYTLPEPLEFDTDYSWRVDTVLIYGPIVAEVIKGRVWSFRVRPHHGAMIVRLGSGHVFDTIQEAIDNALPNDEIRVAAGTYCENIVMKDRVSLYGGYNPENCERDVDKYRTVIDGGGAGSVVTMASGGTIDGFVITGGGGGTPADEGDPNAWPYMGGGVYSNNGSWVTISNNIIKDNVVGDSPFTAGYGAGICVVDGSYIDIENNLIVDNEAYGRYGGRGGGIFISTGGQQISIRNDTLAANTADYGAGIYADVLNDPIANCILWDNKTPSGDVDDLGGTDAIYSNVMSGALGRGNISVDPCFADTNNDDYHLKSEAGRYDPNSRTWVRDEVTSLCIDAGSPSDHAGKEEPDDSNNVRINMGVYGGTAEASKAPANWALSSDLTNDGIVNFKDLAFEIVHGSWRGPRYPGDIKTFDFRDVARLVEDWLEATSWYEP